MPTLEQLEAVKESIEHWEEIAENCGDNIGANNCSLCAVQRMDAGSWDEPFSTDCNSCPLELIGDGCWKNSSYEKYRVLSYTHSRFIIGYHYDNFLNILALKHQAAVNMIASLNKCLTTLEFEDE